MTATTTTPSGAPAWRTWHGYAPLDAGNSERIAAGFGDITEGARRWRLWSYLALDSVKNQYRRTTIGPWWITLQTLAYIIGLAVLFGAIFRRPLAEFIPYVGCGFIIFSYMSGLTSFAANNFVRSGGSIVSNRQPLSVLVMRGVTEEFLQFAHNAILIVAFCLLGFLAISPRMIYALPALVLVTLNGLALGLWLGPMVARFRDVGPLVSSILQMLSFFTPIFWRVDSIRGDSVNAIVAWNPFFYFLEAFRGALIDDPVGRAFVGVAVITVVNVILGLVVFVRTRSRIPYWVS